MVEAKELLYLFQYHLWTLNWRETFSLHYTYFIPIRNTFSSSSFQGSCHFGEASTIAWLKIFTINFKLNVPSLGPRSKLYSGNFCHLGWTEETTHSFSKTGSTKIETQSTKLLPLKRSFYSISSYSHEWWRLNFSLSFKNNIKKTSDEN